MNKKIFLFLLMPLCIFATIEVHTQNNSSPKKEQVGQTTGSKNINSIAETNENENISSETITNETPRTEPSSPMFDDKNYQKNFFRTLILICIFIVLFLIILYIFKRDAPMSKITRKNSRNNIKILERRSLSPQTYLYHIQVGDKQFILSESKVEIRNVSTLDWPDRN